MNRERQRLILIFGLPGTGKTTFAEYVSQTLGIAHFNTDVIRSNAGKRGQYKETDKASIYDELLRLAGAELRQGRSVIIDGTFYKSKLREPFEALGRQHHVTTLWIEICAAEAVVRERVSKKRAYSEADYAVYRKIREEFEPPEEDRLQLYSDRDSLEVMLGKTLEYMNK